MPTLSRAVRPTDPAGGLSVATPEEVVHATRSADGASWIANPNTGTAVRAMLRKGWSPAAAAKAAPAPAPAPAAAVRTPTRAPARGRARAAGGSGAALALLDGSVAKLEAALATGGHDSHLQAMLDAEEGGKTRKGAVKAIKARQDAVA